MAAVWIAKFSFQFTFQFNNCEINGATENYVGVHEQYAKDSSYIQYDKTVQYVITEIMCTIQLYCVQVVQL